MNNRPEPPPSDTNPGVEIKEGDAHSFKGRLLTGLLILVLAGAVALGVYATLGILMEV